MTAIILALVLSAPSAPAVAPAPVANQAHDLWIAGLVQKYYNNTKDFKAKFKQMYKKAYHGPQKPRFGYLWVKKPGLMRWDYVSPRKKKLICDGNKIWIYVPGDKQVFWRDLKASALPTAISFLWGKGNIIADFDIRTLARSKYERKDTVVIKLVPKVPNSNFKHVLFVVDNATGMVRESVLYDHLGNRNHYVFSSPKVNTGVRRSRFQFTPPPGVRVIKATRNVKP
jgi:outer membrane lipoprotein carrier protein